MRRSLSWMLAGAVLLSGLALWGPQPVPPRVVQAVEPAPTNPLEGPSTGPSKAAVATAWPQTLQAINLEPARRNLFAPYVRPVPVAAPTKVQQAAPPPVYTPPPPQAPAMQYIFWGRMRTPAGLQLTYLAKGDTVLPVAEGDRLEEGFLVEHVTDDAVQLLYPPLAQRVSIAISPARAD